jgi:hypothetical protein
MRVTVILTDAEYAEVKRRAGLIPLSAWFRNMALTDDSLLPERADPITEASERSVEPETRSDKAAVTEVSERRQNKRHSGTLGRVEDVTHAAVRATQQATEHTATSRWQSCPCVTCTQKRKNMGMQREESRRA